MLPRRTQELVTLDTAVHDVCYAYRNAIWYPEMVIIELEGIWLSDK